MDKIRIELETGNLSFNHTYNDIQDAIDKLIEIRNFNDHMTNIKREN